MAYIIRKTDGTTLGTILDGTIDDRSATSLQLVGRNYSNYGQIMTDNLVSLLENWAYNIAPPNPIAGQLWWNTSDKRLRIYTGTEFKVISGSTSSSTAPNTTVAGDLWWHQTNKQLYCYDGTAPYSVSGWILVGPERDNTGAKWEQIADSLSQLHTVVSIFVSGTRVAIINSDAEWTPLTPITGFVTVKPGYNVASPGIFNGTANNSIRLDGLESSSYLRSDTDDVTTGSFTVQNNSGITIGLNSNVSLSTATNGNATLRLNTNNRSLNFSLAAADGYNTTLVLNGAANQATVPSLVVSGTAASNSSVTGAMVVTGGLGLGQNLSVGGTGTFMGALYAPTAAAGTANTTVATTAFVVNNAGFLKNKIYAGANATAATTYIDVNQTGPGNVRVVVESIEVATASASGFNLTNGATAVTQPDSYNGIGNARIATTQFVKNATQWWGGSAKFVSTAAPDPGVNDAGSVNGDFWFQYTP